MADLTRTELNDNANSRQADNIVGAIDAFDTRQQDIDLADSAFIKQSDDSNSIIEGDTNLFVEGLAQRIKIRNLPDDTNQDIIDLNSAIAALQGSLIPQGNWNASTNTPDITGETTTGFYWIVNVAGNTDLGGLTDWQLNDWAIKTATGWAQIDNSESVISVAGKTGIVTLDANDIAEVGNRVWLTNLAQIITGEKTFDNMATFESGVIAHRPSISQSDSFTVSGTQINRVVKLTTTGSSIITIDDSSASAFGVDDELDLFWLSDTGGNTVTFAAGGSQTIISDDDLLDIANVKSAVSLKYIGSDTWLLMGKLA